jgi:protein-tyrosine phosphatase
LDDGARSLDESLDMARALVGLGYSRVAVTPHARPGFWLNLYPDISAAVERLQVSLDREKIPLALSPGTEHFFDPELESRLAASTGWGAARKTFLVELPHNQAPPRALPEVFFRLRVRGLRLILAHPERYSAPDAWFSSLREQGVLLQLSLTSLGGKYGRTTQKIAQKFVEAGLFDLASTDAHRADDVKAAGEAIRWIEQRLGAATARRLTAETTEALLSN